MFSSYTCWGQYLHSVSKKVYLTKAASNVFGNREIKWFIIRIYSIFLCQFSCFSNTKEVSTLCEMHITYCSAYMLQYFKIHFILTLRDTIKHVHNKFSTCKQENEGPCSPDGKDFLNNWATEIFLRSVLSYYYWYSALGPVWAETRVQSVDWYGSGTLHPEQVLRGSLPLLSPTFRRSHFSPPGASTSATTWEIPAAEVGTVGENVVR